MHRGESIWEDRDAKRSSDVSLADPGGAGALAWTAFKVGALAFGGGFVIVPLMQADAVNSYHWMSHEQFLNAVAIGQTWQYFVLGVAALALLVLRRGVVPTLLAAGIAGTIAALLGAPTLG